MLRNIMFLLLFIVSIIITLGACIFVIAMSKEGTDIGQIVQLTIVTVILFSIIFAWYFISRRADSEFIQTLGYLCIIFIIMPLFFILWLMENIIQVHMQGKYQSQHATITQYRESFIYWPKFNYPVGLHIEISMSAAFAKDMHNILI